MSCTLSDAMRHFFRPSRLHVTHLFLLLGLMLAFQVPLSAAESQRGVLWRVEVTDASPAAFDQLKRPSYLLGTMHLPDPRVDGVLKSLQPYLKEVDGLSVEVILDAQSQLRLAQLMALPAGQTLRTILEPELYESVRTTIQRKGLPLLALERIKPWAVAVTLMLPRNLSLPMDTRLQKVFQNQSKPVYQLESAEEQMGLYDALSIEDQAEMLDGVIKMNDDIPKLYEELKSAYFSGDIDHAKAINDRLTLESESGEAKAFMKRLIDDRNQTMFERMQDQLKQGAHMFAVGALHLPGEQGLIHKLRSIGFKVTPVF